MEKICSANTDDFEESEFVIIGIPDESQSHALRKGTEDAPNKIRQISNVRDSFERNGKISLGRPFEGSEKKVHDFGNIERELIENIMIRFLYFILHYYLISDERSYADFFTKHFVTEEKAEIHQYTFLQKVARSGCIIKSTFVLAKVMDARHASLNNLYFCKHIFILFLFLK